MMLLKLLTSPGAERIESRVITLIPEGSIGSRLRDAGVVVESLEMSRAIPSPLAVPRLAARLRAWRPDLVQGWLLQGNLMATMAARLAFLRVPVLWNVRWALYDLETESKRSRALLRLSGMLSRNPERVLFNSHRALEQHAKLLGYDPTRSFVIPNGFDLQRFQPDVSARAEVRRELSVPDDAVLVGLIARYHPMKDHANALAAAARLIRDGRKAVFLFAGRDVDASNETLIAGVRALALEPHVRLLGERHDTPRLFAALDLYWTASWARGVAEGFPNVLGEAMASGVPCVATDVGDAAWVLGDVGRVVPPHDADGLAAAASELLDLSPGAFRAEGVRARERIARQFAIEDVVERYHAVYREMLGIT